MQTKLPKVPGRTTPAFGFSYIVERSLRECLAKRQFGEKEKQEVLDYFSKWEDQPSCAFCGTSDVRRWDHLVSVRNDGETVLGNIVLACQPCDDSKGARPFDEWMLGDAPKSPTSLGIQDVRQRVGRLKAYMKEYNYEPVPVEARLTEAELARLKQIRTKLGALRTEADSLIADYRQRTGNR